MNLKVLDSIDLIKWPHRIVDNFFSKDELSWVRGALEKGLSDIKKEHPYYFDSNGLMLSDRELIKAGRKQGVLRPNLTTNGFSCFVPFWNTERYIDVIDDLWLEALNIYDYERNYNSKRKDYFCFLELNIYPPGLEYNWHTDVNYKSLTGGCYIGKEGNGTTLKSGGNEVDVVWRNNRGIFFPNCDRNHREQDPGKNLDGYSSHHRYSNKSGKPRFAVNFNMTHPDNVWQIMSKMISKDKGHNLFEWRNLLKNKRPYNKFEMILLQIRESNIGKK